MIREIRVLIWLKGERPWLGQQMDPFTGVHRRSTKVELLKTRFGPERDIYMRNTKEGETKIETKDWRYERMIANMRPKNIAYLGDGTPPRGDLRLYCRSAEMQRSRRSAAMKLQGELQIKEM